MSFTKILIFNCGASHVSAGCFSLNRAGKLVLENFIVEELEYDFSKESNWGSALVRALRTVVRKHKLKGEAIFIAPGYQLLTKIIKVPVVEKSRQAQTLAYEVQQNIPHPLSDVVWDKHVVSRDEVELEVVVVIAIEAEISKAFCEEVTTFGLRPVAIAAGSILDYNAYCYAYSQSSEDVLLINIRARSSNLLFISTVGFYVRSITLGGNFFTQSLADNLGKSFNAAEALRMKFFSRTLNSAEDDPTYQILQNNAQAFMRRLNTEIIRSIAKQRQQKPDYTLKRVLLTGRGALLPGLPEFLSKKLKVPVEYFNPTANLELGAKVDRELVNSAFYQMSELVGEAYGRLVPDGVDINLLPSSIRDKIAFQRRKLFLVGTAFFLAVAGALPIITHYQTAHPANLLTVEDYDIYKEQLREINQKLRSLQALQVDIRETAHRAAAIRDKIQRVEGLVNSKANWINFFVDLQERLVAVEDVWLEQLKVIRKTSEEERMAAAGRDFLSGRLKSQARAAEVSSLQLRLVGRMIDRENPLAKVSSNVQRRVNRMLNSFTESEFIARVENKKFDTSENGLLRFEFTLIVNPEKPL